MEVSPESILRLLVIVRHCRQKTGVIRGNVDAHRTPGPSLSWSFLKSCKLHKTASVSGFKKEPINYRIRSITP